MSHKEVKMSQEARRQRRAEIAKAIREGATVTQVCERFRVSAAVIYVACKERGVGMRTYRTGAALEVVAALFNQCQSIASISADLGVSEGRVHELYTQARAAGIPLPDRTVPTAEEGW